MAVSNHSQLWPCQTLPPFLHRQCLSDSHSATAWAHPNHPHPFPCTPTKLRKNSRPSKREESERCWEPSQRNIDISIPNKRPVVSAVYTGWYATYFPKEHCPSHSRLCNWKKNSRSSLCYRDTNQSGFPITCLVRSTLCWRVRTQGQPCPAHYVLMAQKNWRGIDSMPLIALPESSIQDCDSPAASEKEGCGSRKCGFWTSSNHQKKMFTGWGCILET